MDLKEIKETPLWVLYQKSVNYLRMHGLYTDTDINYNMFNGNQWKHAKLSGIEPIQLNIIKRIVNHKVSILNSNLWSIHYSAENFEDRYFREVAVKVCDLLNKRASRIWEKNKLDVIVYTLSEDAAINDEGILYSYWDEDKKYSITELLNKNDICYGDETNSDIQSQPYILIKQRKPLNQVIEEAESLGLSEEQISMISSDNEVLEEPGEQAKYELNDMVTVITKLYREKGTIHFEQTTKNVELQKDVDSGLNLYPVCHMIWEEKKGSARGEGEVRNLVPNQIEINKTIMRRLLTVKQTAYPQRVAIKGMISNPEAISNVGSTIWINSNTVDDIRKVYSLTAPAQMSTDVEKIQSDLINITSDLSNAGDSATGNVDPEKTSGRAILAIQQASQQPLSKQATLLKSCLEDLARIWLDQDKTYASEGLAIENEVINPVTGESTYEMVQVPHSVLQALEATVKIDITPKSAFDKYAQELSLENMYQAGKLTDEEYIELLDDDSVMPKQKLERIMKKRKEQQKKIEAYEEQAQLLKQKATNMIGVQGDIANIGQAGENLINQVMGQ